MLATEFSSFSSFVRRIGCFAFSELSFRARSRNFPPSLMRPVPRVTIVLLALVCPGSMQSLCLAQSQAAAPEPQLFGENLISTADDESHPAFTPDGKMLYFLKNDPSFNHWTIFVSHNQNGKW